MPEGRPFQPQLVDTVLLGKVIRAFGDLGRAVLGLYTVGVPLGLGVDLPRTPEVFPAKTKWSLKEQPDWGGVSDRAASYQGTHRKNYSSAVGFAAQGSFSSYF